MKKFIFVLTVSAAILVGCNKSSSVIPASSFVGDWMAYDTVITSLSASTQNFTIEKVNETTLKVKDFPKTGLEFLMNTNAPADTTYMSIGAIPLTAENVHVSKKSSSMITFTYHLYQGAVESDRRGTAVRL